jgi:uncharacterized membrane-anchored protein
MSRNKIILLVFTFVILAQLAVPAMMIIERENVLNSGKEYKFRSAPRDPYDPFRGKYITMSYVSNETKVLATQKWEIGETVYVQFTEDVDGYAIIKSASKSAPENTSDYLKTTVQRYDNYSDNEEGAATLCVYYPFDRFYMEESKAYGAEMAYTEVVEGEWEGWNEESEGGNWGNQEWESFIKETNELYMQLQDPSISLITYSNLLNDYKYLIENIEYQSEINFYDSKISELDQLQNTINTFDYAPLVKVKEEVDIVVEQESVAYSLVCLKNGRAVLKDVLINEVSAKDLHLDESKGH